MIKNQQPCPIVDENERSLRFEYRFRRYGIIVLSLIILTALSGLCPPVISVKHTGKPVEAN